MAKLKIMSIELAAPKSRKDEVMDYLQRKGVVELTKPEETGKMSFSDQSIDIMDITRKQSVVSSAVDILSKFYPVKKPITAMLEPRKEISDQQFLLMKQEFEEIYSECKSIVKLHGDINSLKADIIRNNTLIDELIPWEKADMPLTGGETKNVSYMFGSFRGEVSEEYLMGVLAKELPNNPRIEIEIISSDLNATCIAVFTCKDESEEVENVLRSVGFIRAPECQDKIPAERMAELRSETEVFEKEVNVCLDEMGKKVHIREKIQFAEDYLSICREKITAYGSVPESERVFYVKGYIAKRDADRVSDYLQKHFDAAVEISEPGEDEDVPVLLSNNFFAAPLEGITGMYSLPGKADPDPTGIMAFFYYFFFGMMLSDAGYGLLMVLATGGVLLFKRNMEKKMKNMCLMYFFCGLSTVFWGAMYGSWFGDMINVIRTEFLGLQEVRLYIWMEPVNSLMELMVYCFLFGLVHLFVGVGVKAVSDWRHGDKFGAFCDSVPTYLTILGIAPIFFGLFTEVPPVLSSIGTPVLIIGLILVVLTAGRSSKSLVGKLGGGLYEVYNLVGGYLGDVLSYARLLALGLSTGVIAEVMNMLGVLPSNKVLKLFMFIIVAIVGHIANFAINVIGAYVHTNRLQYVEFFGKFYEGGGRAFVPFEANSKYFKFKEEN